MTSAKNKINTLVKEYKKIFKEEYLLVKKFVVICRKELKDEKHGRLNTQTDTIERKMCEIPETLYASLVQNLNINELKWFKSKTGHRWFARRYAEFRVIEKI